MSIDDGATRRLADLGVAGYADPVEIGRGGFAVVYRARRVAFGQDVAIKVLDGAVVPGEAIPRFERERRVLGVLAHHPNIVTVYDAGVAAGGSPYLVMEYLGGGPLSARVEREGPLEVWRAVDVVVRLCGALETAHRSGVLHRDVKPENVLVSRYGEPVLADFGIARIRGALQTRSGVVTATLAHAPPEVLDGRPATARSDVYSLASTLFALLTGAPPFLRVDDEGVSPMIARVFRDPVPDLRPRGVPEEVCALIEQAMAKDPAGRPATALEWGRAFQDLQRGGGREVSPLVVEDVPEPVGPDAERTGAHPVRSTTRAPEPPPDPTAPEPSDRSERPTRLLRPGGLSTLVAVLFVLVPLAGAGYLLFSEQKPRDGAVDVLEVVDFGYAPFRDPAGRPGMGYAVLVRNPTSWVASNVDVDIVFTDPGGESYAQRTDLSDVRPGVTVAAVGVGNGLPPFDVELTGRVVSVAAHWWLEEDGVPDVEVTAGPAVVRPHSRYEALVSCPLTTDAPSGAVVDVDAVFVDGEGGVVAGYPGSLTDAVVVGGGVPTPAEMPVPADYGALGAVRCFPEVRQ